MSLDGKVGSRVAQFLLNINASFTCYLRHKVHITIVKEHKGKETLIHTASQGSTAACVSIENC